MEVQAQTPLLDFIFVDITLGHRESFKADYDWKPMAWGRNVPPHSNKFSVLQDKESSEELEQVSLDQGLASVSIVHEHRLLEQAQVLSIEQDKGMLEKDKVCRRKARKGLQEKQVNQIQEQLNASSHVASLESFQSEDLLVGVEEDLVSIAVDSSDPPRVPIEASSSDFTMGQLIMDISPSDTPVHYHCKSD
ncbi:hypothetical protein QJS10_CPB11g01513 [Acorus calamus]|uniref:Uncharacterized protein n=1 Tax=Acorus calamus TaxID=4465 RepID=A0AAV9DUM7_ACOCL|nr:hypothetical protein QJS10_CPB11g01513 [Acorus calamus]